MVSSETDRACLDICSRLLLCGVCQLCESTFWRLVLLIDTWMFIAKSTIFGLIPRTLYISTRHIQGALDQLRLPFVIWISLEYSLAYHL